jgi:hypothetical protein
LTANTIPFAQWLKKKKIRSGSTNEGVAWNIISPNGSRLGAEEPQRGGSIGDVQRPLGKSETAVCNSHETRVNTAGHFSAWGGEC